MKDLLHHASPTLCTSVTAALHGLGWLTGGGFLLVLFLLRKLVEVRGEKEAEAAVKRITDSLAALHGKLEPLLEDQSRRAELVKLLQEGIDFGDIPPELKSDCQFLIAGLFAERTEAKIDEGVQQISARIGEPTLRSMTVAYAGRFFDLPHGPLREAMEHDFVATKARDLAESLSEIQRSCQLHLKLWIPAQKEKLTDEEARSAGRLIFSERLVPKLFGRDQEMGDLLMFLREDKPVSWWLVHAAGGMGKSRLALEWLLVALTEGWYGGFLRGGFPDVTDLMRWRPQDKTVFVIDYAASYAKSCREAIDYFESQAKMDPSYPNVRILLLERTFNPSEDWVGLLGRRQENEMDRHVAESCHLHDEKGTPVAREMLALDLNDFYDTFENAYFNVSGKRPTVFAGGEKDKAMAFFTSEEFQRRRRRPLYACLCALKATEPGLEGIAGIDNWRANDLEEYVLQHEARIWGDEIKAEQPDVHTAFIATVLGGLTKEDWQAWPPHPLVENADEGRARRVASHTPDDEMVVPALEPDLVGEAFVRMRLDGRLFNGGSKYTVANQSVELFKWLLTEEDEHGQV